MKTIYRKAEFLQKMLEVLYSGSKRGLVNTDDDCVSVTLGDAGAGKSLFLLSVLDAWYSRVLKRPLSPSDVEAHCPLTSAELAAAIGKFKEHDFILSDEAIDDLSQSESMTKKTKIIYTLFNKIRGKRLVFGLAIPQLYDLHKKFILNRVRIIFYLKKNQNETRDLYVFGRPQIEKLVPKYFYNVTSVGKTQKIENIPSVLNLGIQPFCMIEDFPEYKGALLQPYKEFKNAHMRLAATAAEMELSGMSPPTEASTKLSNVIKLSPAQEKELYQLRSEKNAPFYKIGEHFGMSMRTAKRIYAEYVIKLSMDKNEEGETAE